jgi:hypothetical protein
MSWSPNPHEPKPHDPATVNQLDPMDCLTPQWRVVACYRVIGECGYVTVRSYGLGAIIMQSAVMSLLGHVLKTEGCLSYHHRGGVVPIRDAPGGCMCHNGADCQHRNSVTVPGDEPRDSSPRREPRPW